MHPEDFVARALDHEHQGLTYARPMYGTPAEMAHFMVEQLWLYGKPICNDRGDHDWTIKVPETSNMYLCFRCGEPGWDVPPRQQA